ncbi:MAG: sugar transferase, partial [Lachnospiraceae bacterium]|nr:sugar transferase [Lachnospiraceae bacterium]MCI9439442.1 sugar transferase [Lachnospiraceae bacterium]
DTKYITEWSMALDLRILVRTVGVVFRKDGAM